MTVIPINKKWLRTLLKILFSISILLILFYQGKKELSALSLRESIKVMQSIPPLNLILIIILGLIGVSTMFFYDYFLVRSLKIEIPIKRVFRVSWMANTLNSVIGFGGLLGASVRLMLYGEHFKDQRKLVSGIAWMAFAMLSGVSFLSWLVMFNILPATTLFQSKQWLYLAVIVVMLFLPLYILSSKLKGKDVASPLLAIKYTIVSIIEWLSAATVAYYSLYLINGSAPLLSVYGVFVIAAVAGLISMIPGGLGTFDITYLLGLKTLGLNDGVILTSLLLYRIVYFFIPFIIGLIFSIYEFGSTALAKMENKRIIGPALETSNVFLIIQKAWLIKLPFIAMGFFVALTSFNVLFTGVTPYEVVNSFFYSLFPKSIIFFLDGLMIATSLILLLQVKGVYYGTKRSYHMVFYATIISMPLTILKGESLIAMLGTIILLLLLLFTKKQFKRIRRVLNPWNYVQGSLAFIMFYAFYYLLIITIYEARQEYQLSLTYSELMTVYLLSIVLFAILNYLLHLTFERKQKDKIETPVTEEELKTILHTYGGNYLSHLAFLGDKSFFVSSDKKAFLQFAKTGNKLVVLGDPSGDKSSFYALLTDFYRRAYLFGYEIIFYQIKAENMPMYHDFGNSFFKLGEEALVDLTSFTLTGKKNANLRATKNRFEREGYTFEVIEPPFTDDFFNELKLVSDAWLGKKKEKGFSLGFFNRDYLSREPIAILKNQDGKIIAFLSTMPVYQKEAVSVDLMRHYPDAPSGTMDVMFIHMFEWAKERHYKTFNVGMAPLSNVGLTETSFIPERIAAAVFNNVRYMYSFSGLRRFKQKYHPTWEARYMAYRKYRLLPIAIVNVTKLISRKK